MYALGFREMLPRFRRIFQGHQLGGEESVRRRDVLRRAGAQNGALELVGRSVAIVRIQELIRRAAQVDGGVLLIADRGADVESVAQELHDRARRPAAAFIHVACASEDEARECEAGHEDEDIDDESIA